MRMQLKKRVRITIMLSNNQIILPTNQKFGSFFTFVFLASGLYFFFESKIILAYCFTFLAFTLSVITILKPECLLPFNRLWMGLGLLLGKVVSPIVLGVIFFGLFAPIAIFMRFFGRDELRLKQRKQSSHWINRETETQYISFKQQF